MANNLPRLRLVQGPKEAFIQERAEEILRNERVRLMPRVPPALVEILVRAVDAQTSLDLFEAQARLRDYMHQDALMLAAAEWNADERG